MLPLLGLGNRLHPELDAAFLTAPDKAVDGLPSAAELKRHWGEVNDRLLAEFGNLTASDWVHKHTAVSEEDFAVNGVVNSSQVSQQIHKPIFSRRCHETIYRRHGTRRRAGRAGPGY